VSLYNLDHLSAPNSVGDRTSSAASFLMDSFIALELGFQRRGQTQQPRDRPLVFEHDELAKPLK